MDATTSRTIRIGATSIGLLGLDIAINQAAARQLDKEEAMNFLYRMVKKNNYIPTAMAEKYKVALFKEYAKHLQGEVEEEEMLIVRIFGTGCLSCNGLQKLIIEVLADMNIGADIEQIHDPDEIGRAGILQTPALMINNRLKSSGLLPTRSQIEHWIRELRD